MISNALYTLVDTLRDFGLRDVSSNVYVDMSIDQSLSTVALRDKNRMSMVSRSRWVTSCNARHVAQIFPSVYDNCNGRRDIGIVSHQSLSS